MTQNEWKLMVLQTALSLYETLLQKIFFQLYKAKKFHDVIRLYFLQGWNFKAQKFKKSEKELQKTIIY